jgi:hypothetical protein
MRKAVSAVIEEITFIPGSVCNVARSTGDQKRPRKKVRSNCTEFWWLKSNLECGGCENPLNSMKEDEIFGDQSPHHHPSPLLFYIRRD